MNARRSLLTALIAAGCGLACRGPKRRAQSYPQRPIKIVVDRPAGVPHDILARALSDKLSASLKQTVIVDNRVGAGGNLAAEFVARSAPDGYTLLVALDTTLTVNPTLYKKLSVQSASGFAPADDHGDAAATCWSCIRPFRSIRWLSSSPTRKRIPSATRTAATAVRATSPWSCSE